MPNTRADLDRLRHHWEHDHGAWEPEDGDEMIALCERLLLEREDSAQEVRYCHGMQAKADDLAAKLLLEIGRQGDDLTDARDHACKAIAAALDAQELFEITRAEVERLKAGIVAAIRVPDRAWMIRRLRALLGDS